MSKPTKPDDPTATSPEDNNYCPQRSSFHEVYSGDLTVQDTEFEARDAKVDATRSDFAHQDKSPKPEAWKD